MKKKDTEITELKTAVDELNKKIAAAQTEYQNGLKKQDTEITELKTTVDDLKKKLAAAQVEYQNALKKQDTDISELKKKLAEAERTLDMQEQENQRLLAQQQAGSDRPDTVITTPIEPVITDVQKKKIIDEYLASGKAILQTEYQNGLQKKDTEITILKKNNTELKDRVVALEKSLEQQKTDDQNALQKKDTELAVLKKNNNEQKEKIVLLERAIEQQKTDDQNAIQKKDTELGTLKKDNAGLKEKLTLLEKSLEKQKTENLKLTKQLENSQNTTNKEPSAPLITDVQEKQIIDEYLASGKALTLEQHKEKIQQKDTELGTLQGRVEDLSKKITALEDDLKKQRADDQKVIKQLEVKLEQSTKTNQTEVQITDVQKSRSLTNIWLAGK